MMRTASGAYWLRVRRGRGCCCVGPVAVTGGDLEIDVVGEFQRDEVEARVGRLRLEAEHVTVRDVVGDRGETLLEALGVAKLEVFSAGKVGHGFRDIALEPLSGLDDGHPGDQ